MKIEILSSATEDLVDGYHFYERQATGLGSYFLDSLYSDIDSLLVYAGIHRVVYGKHRALSKVISVGEISRGTQRGKYSDRELGRRSSGTTSHSCWGGA